MPDEISAAEHLDYLVSSVRLMMWFSWNSLEEHPEETFVDTVCNRTDLWRRTSLNPDYIDVPHSCTDSPEWAELLKALETIYNRNQKKGTVLSFENEALLLLMPFLTPRIERDLEDIRNKVDLANYQCGSLRYALEPEPGCRRRIGFHIANDCYPVSPFEDPRYFPRCFIELMDQCESKFNVTEISTETWMNSYPRWQKLFPPEWMDHMSPPNYDVRWHYGFWGQFVTARRTFNHKLGRQFRETGRIPFPPRSSWCTIKAMRNHLDSFKD